MSGSILYLRSRRVLGVILGFFGAAVLLVVARASDLVWSPLGGTAFPVAIILPLGMACVVATAEDSDSRMLEILGSRPLAGRHACVSVGYLLLGSVVIVASLGGNFQTAGGGLQYGAATAVRNFLLLTGLAWTFVPLLGGLRSCVVPTLVAGLATTLLAGSVSPPAWNLLLLGSTAPDYVTAVVAFVVAIGLAVSSRASLTTHTSAE